MTIEGQIKKMITENGQPIRYYLTLKDDYLDVNQHIGKKIHLFYDHNECLGCGLDKPIYRMGYCSNCFFTLPQANESIIRPELSTAHLGIEQRDLEWEKEFELKPHIAYLALSSNLKVGVTRVSQIPTRWIDQGAGSAIILAETENRYQAGMIEVALKAHVADKTNYRKMLLNQTPEINLIEQKELFKQFIPEEQSEFFLPDNRLFTFDYPVENYPQKIKNLKLTRNQEFEGVLSGIRGQYWIFEDGTVWNVRGHEGTYIRFDL